MIERIKSIISNKNSIDYLSNLASIAIMTVCGFVMTAAVSYTRGADALGYFNESYAWYMVLSQVSVFGIHMSVLKYVPEESADNKGTIFHSGIAAVTLTSLFVLLSGEAVLVCCRGLLWRVPLMIALTGLPFFSINKVLLNYLNALYSMISYAVFQSIRFLLLAACVIILICFGVDDKILTATFPISEIILCILLYIYTLIRHREKIKIDTGWMRTVTMFGAKMLPANLIVELNTKTDVIMLGLLLKDAATIGIYSFAILFTEGFYTLYFIVRRMYNPGISEYNSKGKLEEYVSEANNAIRKYYLILSFVAFAAVIIAYDILYRLVGTSDYKVGLVYIAIIGLSIVINGKHAIIWGDILCQTGFPLDESKINIITVMSNAIMNVFLIKLLGAYGAAIATALSYFVTRYLQRKYVKNRLGLSL